MRRLTSVVALGLLGAIAGCNCGTEAVHTSGSTGATTAGTASGGTGGASSGTGGSNGSSGSTGDAGCTGNSDCGGGGACLSGVCCAAGSTLCNRACCAAGNACLFDACVAPGASCHTANDCPANQYCETAFGADGGAGLDAGPGCSAVPIPGRCLPLPPVCGADAGADAGCLALCEYHPAVGNLDAVAKWRWGPNAAEFPNDIDVWSTPTVGRLVDTNCDGVLDEQDAPAVVFVSGDGLGSQCAAATPSQCRKGVLRALDGRTGQELWSLDRAAPDSGGWAGLSVALGDIDGDGRMDIAAATGEGRIALVSATGTVERLSDQLVGGASASNFGWGGGLAIADMEGTGHPQIAYGASVFDTDDGGLTRRFLGTDGIGGQNNGMSLSTFARLVPGGSMQLLAGNTAYLADGGKLWKASVSDGFSAVGDFDQNGTPEAVLIGNGVVYLLDGATGAVVMGPFTLQGTGHGGPPTVADFDGDGRPEIGVAQQNYYSVLKPDFDAGALTLLWKTPNHDLSSSVTGSTVFDFEGDGRAEVVYADECFLWVFDGQTGAVKFAASTDSFTGTEASVVADVDGDGRAEMVMVSNGASPKQWKCIQSDGGFTTVNGVTWTPGPNDGGAYRGVTLWADRANSWVGTRTLWNEHGYHVSNICDDRDSACAAPNVYGSIPRHEADNWTVPWLNDFRQNVQDRGLFDAPDAVVSLDALGCTQPAPAQVSVRNLGQASLPANVEVGVFDLNDTGTPLAVGTTTRELGPGQTEQLALSVPGVVPSGRYFAKILVDPANPTFHECRADNDLSGQVAPTCLR